MAPHGSSPNPPAHSPTVVHPSSVVPPGDTALPRGSYPLPADLFFVPGGVAQTSEDAAILKAALGTHAGRFGHDHLARPGSSPPSKIGPGRRHSRSFGRRAGRGSPSPPPAADEGRILLDTVDPGAASLRALEADTTLHSIILSRTNADGSRSRSSAALGPPGDIRSTGSLGLTSLAVSSSGGKRPGSALSVDTSAADDPRLPLTHDSSSAVSLCPSLSALAAAAFHPLTGAKHENVRAWADAMVMTYSDLDAGRLPPSSPARHALGQADLRGRLRSLASLPPGDVHSPVKHAPPRPCGYVFRTGDIAWNCRTCQQDPTCVLCDECFRNSDHRGHEVTFHRTSPGGCCDCGDTEAWRAEGCCPRHRPRRGEGEEETARSAAADARRKGEAMARSIPAATRAAIGAVVASAVHCVTEAAEGTGAGTDLAQWQYKWAEQACQLAGGAPDAPTVVPPTAPLAGEGGKKIGWCPAAVWKDGGENGTEAPLPEDWCLDIRLHNDDIHTFDEVIEALYTRGSGLVSRRSDAENLTNHVDADGQVTVMQFTTFKAATAGFYRLKERGLQVSCVPTAQVNAELRAVKVLAWLTDLCSVHPGVSAIVAHALIDVGEGDDLFAGVAMWPRPRMLPQWLGAADASRRWGEKNGFPVEDVNSYLTQKEARDVHASGHRNTAGRFSNFAADTGSPVTFYRSTWSLYSSASSSWITNCEGLTKSPHSLWGVLPVPLRSAAPGPVQKTRRFVVDTDLRKRQVPEALTNFKQTHNLPGLHVISGVALEDHGEGQKAVLPPAKLAPILSKSSYVAPLSPLLQLLLLDPYPTKALRAKIHSLFLPLLVDARFKARFGAAFAVAYKSLSTLFCAGVGTDGDSAFSFTVQIFTTGSLVRSLCDPTLTAPLLDDDHPDSRLEDLITPCEMSGGATVLPLPHLIVRSIHTNIEGLPKNVQRLVQNVGGPDYDTTSLTWQEGEHPRTTMLPVSGCDEFLDSRSTRHKRLPHMLRDLEYILETPGTALSLLLNGEPVTFADAWGRLLRLSQGMDEQKRKPSGSHVEYENQRWIEAFSWTLNMSGVTEALAESGAIGDPKSARTALCNLVTSLVKEMKMWLYREEVVGDKNPTMGFSPPHSVAPPSESLQKCTLDVCPGVTINADGDMKMTEGQLDQFQRTLSARSASSLIRVTHSPLAGDRLSLHIHLHRAIARAVRSLCSVPSDPTSSSDWRIPVLDDPELFSLCVGSVTTTKNLKVHWTSDVPPEGDNRAVKAAAHVATAKIVHSLLDHPLRCLVATKEIEAHMWARNGQSMIGMAVNYSTPTLCRNFRDLDLTLLQFSAAGFTLAGPVRTFGLMVNRFSLDGYMCDPTLRPGGPTGAGGSPWANPPRMSDQDHAALLAESFFVLLCLLVTEMPPPAPAHAGDTTPLDAVIRRELLHALSIGPCAYSEAFSAALAGVTQNEGHAPPSFRASFSKVMAEVGQEGGSGGGANSSTSRGRNFELRASAAEGYDPCFPHLQRSDHQGAMEAVARKRRAFLKEPGRCMPLVAHPPECHRRFLSARLILHVPGIDEAARRTLLFAVTGGKWLPPLSPPEHTVRQTAKPFGPATVASSAVSFLEVLQILTLQLHTLTELGLLHEKMRLDDDCAQISKGATVENYLRRLTFVPPSMKDCWAFGSSSPLSSAGSAANRPSILGLLIVLYEHRNDRKDDPTPSNNEESSGGGARTLVSDGLRWFLRTISHLTVNSDVNLASDMARNGICPPAYAADETGMLIDGMLHSLPGLWPRTESDPVTGSASKVRAKAAQKAAQAKALARMKSLQSKFADTLDPSQDIDDSEEDQCIICRSQGDGPVGSIGHVQRCRLVSLRSRAESNRTSRFVRVVGDKGCQVRATEALDSSPVAFLKVGSVVEIVGFQSQPKGVERVLRSRRVKVQHERPCGKMIEGWASMASATGYVILSPLSDLSYVRWGSTRPVVQLCGHSAHISCVEAHCLSLHQRATDDQPYDGRFAANITEGEFLCPLCKQLSNVVVPKIDPSPDTKPINVDVDVDVDSDSKGAEVTLPSTQGMLHSLTRGVVVSSRRERTSKDEDASARYGDSLLQAMQPAWETPDGSTQPYHSSVLRKWDYEEPSADGGIYQDVLRNLRTIHIGWAGLGYKSSSAEASARTEYCDDPWSGYDNNRRDTHTECIELTRLVLSTADLFLTLNKKVSASPSGSDKGLALIPTLLGHLLKPHLRPKSLATPNDTCRMVAAIVSSLPCHIAKDQQLHHRHIARTAACGRWIAEGSTPTPLAVRALNISRPLTGCFNDASKCVNGSGSFFRPGVAAGFLYLPTLAWDLNTLAAAVLSTMVTDRNLSCKDLMEAIQSLLVARLVQAIATPGGIMLGDVPDDASDDAEFEWEAGRLETEGKAMKELITLANKMIDGDGAAATSALPLNKMIWAIGYSVLPFARSLILMLRSLTAVLRARGIKTDSISESLDHFDTMSIDYGMHLCCDILGMPLPSTLMENEVWRRTIEIWIREVVFLESHHGSRGKTVLGRDQGWTPSYYKPKDSKGTVIMESESAEVEVSTSGIEGNTNYDERALQEFNSHVGQASISMDDMDDDNEVEAEDDEMMVDLGLNMNFPGMAAGEASDEDMGAETEINGDEDVQVDGSGRPIRGDRVQNVSSNGSVGSVSVNDLKDESIRRLDQEHASVMRGSVIPFQPSLLGREMVGVGPREQVLDVVKASKVMCDMSHFGLVHRSGLFSSGLIRLPTSFVELYGLVNSIMGTGHDESDEQASGETAICLLTGTVMRSGAPRRPYARDNTLPGSCTLHARRIGSGVGIFFLVSKCTVLLVHNNKSAYSASLFVDENGEEDPGLRRGRPLFLKDLRYQALEKLWRNHGVPREVAQIRSTSERVIRDNWY